MPSRLLKSSPKISVGTIFKKIPILGTHAFGFGFIIALGGEAMEGVEFPGAKTDEVPWIRITVEDKISSMVNQGVSKFSYWLTLFITEQEIHLSLSISKRGYLLRNGRVIKEGSASALMESRDVRALGLGEEIDKSLSPSLLPEEN